MTMKTDIVICSKCNGSGKFIYKSGMTGPCYQCNGKGSVKRIAHKSFAISIMNNDGVRIDWLHIAPEAKMKPSEKPVRLPPVAAIKTSWTQSLQLKAGLSTHIKQYNAVFAP